MSEQAIERALRNRLNELSERMREEESVIRALQHGEIDAVVVFDEKDGPRIEHLRSDEPHYRTIVEMLPQGVATVLVDGSVIYANRHLASRLATPPESLLGTSLIERVAGDDRAKFAAMLQRALGAPQELAVSLRFGDGEAPVLASAVRLPMSGTEAIGLVIVDLSDQVARHAAEEASRAKDDLIASVSHELRTPLTSMMGWLQLLEHEMPVDGYTGEALRHLKNAVLAEVKIVDDLLDLSRSERGSLAIAPDDVDLREPLRTALSFVELQAQNKTLALTVEMPEQPPIVRGDTDRLRQIFVNLLTNAVKFTPAAGRIAVRCRIEGDLVAVEVADSGIGLTREVLPFVFEPFWRSERAKGYPGLGIGLAITRRLAEAHGGSIAVASDGVGRGTTFTVKLPLAG